ncbi:hypothetical protein [Nonomuraea recticatena]|uniref:hypothetical protein n=1 Tax=Nonomuraea recticatena TaxID=46178 RepID=UPI0031F9F074
MRRRHSPLATIAAIVVVGAFICLALAVNAASKAADRPTFAPGGCHHLREIFAGHQAVN